MRLLAPAGTINSVKAVLDCGADDVYLGAQSPYLNIYSFTGRGKFSKNGNIVLPQLSELPEIVNIAHGYGAKVHFLANVPFLSDGPEKNKGELIKYFKEYVMKGIDSGVDALVVGDLGALKIVKELNTNLKLVASSYFDVQNVYSVKLLSNLGVSQVILSYQINLQDIIEIAKQTKIKIEVFGHGSCSFYGGSCNLFHDAGEKTGGIEVGYPCRGYFNVKKDNVKLGRMRFLDCFKTCSICSIPHLIKANVNSFKVVGRDLDLSFIMEVIKTYRKAFDLANKGENLNEKYNEIVPIWWKKVWCDVKKRCRYKY